MTKTKQFIRPNADVVAYDAWLKRKWIWTCLNTTFEKTLKFNDLSNKGKLLSKIAICGSAWYSAPTNSNMIHITIMTVAGNNIMRTSNIPVCTLFEYWEYTRKNDPDNIDCQILMKNTLLLIWIKTQDWQFSHERKCGPHCNIWEKRLWGRP